MTFENVHNSVLRMLLAVGAFAIFIASPKLFAQSHPIPDSLLFILNDSNSDKAIQVKAYEDIIEFHSNQGNDKTVLNYLDQLKIFAEEKESEFGLLKYWQLSGIRQDQKGNYDEAIQAYNLALPKARSLKDKESEAELLSATAKLYARRGQFDTARTMSGRAINIGRTSENPKSLSEGLVALGNTEQMAGNFEKALGYYVDTDSIFQNSELQNSNKHGIILINMGLIYNGALGDVDKAKEYLIAALNLSPKISDRLYYSTTGRLGNLWVRDKEFQKADSLFNIAIAGLQKLDVGRDLAVSTMYYGESRVKQGDHTGGLNLLLEAKEKFDALSDRRGQGLVNRRLANFYLDREQFDKSEQHLKQVFKYTPKTAANRVAILKEIAAVFAKQNKFEKAYDSLLVHTELLDSLYESEYQSDLSELETKYQSAQKEKEIVNLQLIQSQQESKFQKFILWGIIGIISLLALWLFYFVRSRQKTLRNNHLVEIDHLKSKVFSDISHEFRTPLSLISGPVEIIAEKVDDLSSIQQELNIVRRNTSKLNHLVDSVQNLSKLDAGQLSLQIRPGELQDHLRIIGASFESMAAIKDLSFIVDLELPEHKYYYDPDHLETIIYNLLSNAIKFTNSGEIRLVAKHQNGQSIITVSDTGVGLSEKEQKKIFNRYHRVNSQGRSVEGIGIGLALTNELTKLHLGNIEVQSKLNKGTSFIVTIPTNEEFYHSRGFEIGPQFIPILADKSLPQKVLIDDAALINNDHPLVLVVEDNRDMRLHLASLFYDEYSIVLANDGEEGLKKAMETIPNIIISDLMMPVMDGQTLLKAVKTDPRTSHIPFIMLTANHLEEAKLQGLEQRLDDYLTKPFSNDEIKLKVKNHILLRDQLKSKYQNSNDEDISEYQQVNETEQQFWNQLNEVVHKNINNAHFSADQFAHAMFMSRMQLHRKLKAMTGLSTTRYVRNERLKIAHKMLATNDLTIANVAYEVGFTSPSFFSQCFKDKYGVAPKEVVDSK